MSVLTIAEHNGEALADNFPAAVAAVAGVLDSCTDILVAGKNCTQVAHLAAAYPGVRKVLQAECSGTNPVGQAEDVGQLVADLASDYLFIVMADSTWAKQVLPRAAAHCDAQMLTGVREILGPDTYVRPIYAGKIMARVRVTSRPVFLSLRATAFNLHAESFSSDRSSERIRTLPAAPAQELSEWLGLQASPGERPDLASAKIVLCGGRGIGGKEGFALLEQLAAKLNAAVGATRAAVDAGDAPNDLQVGQTGKIIAPDLYMGFGISGAIQHLAGIKDSKTIVAVNRDADAPLAKIADYRLIADACKSIRDLISAL